MKFVLLEMIQRFKYFGKNPTIITLPSDLYYQLKKELEECTIYKEGFFEMSINGVRILFGSKLLSVEFE